MGISVRAFKWNRFFNQAIGDRAAFNLESRIFNGVALASIIALVINGGIKLLLGQPLPALLILLCAGCGAWQYRLSRFSSRLNQALLFFGLFGNALFGLIYFDDGAIDGPSLYAFILLLFIVMVIAPRKQYALWMLLNVFTVMLLLLLTYYYPQLVRYTSHQRTFRLFNIGYNYALFAGMIGLLTIFVKNTYRRQSRLLEEKAHQLQRANQTKETLMSIIAHDLRSPLASLTHYLEALTVYSFSPEEKQSMERELLSKTRYIDEMLFNLLSWAVNQNQGFKTELIRLSLNEVGDRVVKLLQAVAAEKNITLHQHIPEAVAVLADKDMLELIIRNLVSNAIKFTPPGGEVSLSCQFEKGACKVLVNDNGVGISAEVQKTLFSTETRPAYGTRKEKGAGLGLVLCKDFIEMQQGRIGFEHRNGGGTTFYIELRLAI